MPVCVRPAKVPKGVTNERLDELLPNLW